MPCALVMFDATDISASGWLTFVEQVSIEYAIFCNGCTFAHIISSSVSIPPPALESERVHLLCRLTFLNCCLHTSRALTTSVTVTQDSTHTLPHDYIYMCVPDLRKGARWLKHFLDANLQHCEHCYDHKHLALIHIAYIETWQTLVQAATGTKNSCLRATLLNAVALCSWLNCEQAQHRQLR